jgi:hypothetical protein
VPPPVPRPDDRKPGWPPRLSPRLLAGLLPSVLANVVEPPLAYALARPHLTSSAEALLVAMALPVVWTLASFAWRRRADPLGLASVTVTVIALAATYLSGGSTLALELQDPAETAALGLACIVSVIARKPLYLMALRLAARRNAKAARMVTDPVVRRTSTVSTAIIGAILLVHATAISVLALTLKTSTFLAVYRLVGLPIIAVGVAVLIWYRRRQGWKLREILAD